MTSTAGDMSLFFKTVNEKIAGLMGTYVDDIIAGGDSQFELASEKTSERFESKPKEFENFRFAGVYVEKISEGYIIHQ